MSLFLRAARGEDTQRAPIWMMRQAGRYLPEYREMKEKWSFWDLCIHPELVTEVTLQPLRRYALDAAIVFSDIMTPLASMGLDIDFRPGPVIANPVRSMAEAAALVVPETDEIAPFVADSIRMLRKELQVPLIGFGGAPLTLATYTVEGKGSKDYALFRQFLWKEPAAADLLLERITDVTVRYLRRQVEAGAQAVQLFDSWAGIHDEASYRRFGLPWASRVFEGLADLDVPRIYIAVASGHLMSAMAELPCEVMSLDWRMPLSLARTLLPGMALQGNLDPAILLAPPEVIEREAQRVLREGLGGAHIFNLGHGIMKETPPDHAGRLVDVVHAFDRHAAER